MVEGGVDKPVGSYLENLRRSCIKKCGIADLRDEIAVRDRQVATVLEQFIAEISDRKSAV